MLRYSAATFHVVVSNFALATCFLLSYEDLGGRRSSIPASEPLDRMASALEDMKAEIRKLPVSASFRAQVERLLARVKDPNADAELHQIAAVAQELQKNLATELAEHLFFVVPSERKVLYSDPQSWFGEEVADRFPDTTRDFRDACRCFALAQWTASVFHSMRVLERGLWWLAQKAGLSPDVVSNNWKNIIDQIEKQIRDLEKLPASKDKAERLEFFSQAATDFRYFKDAWRNYVSHSKKDYGEQEARNVLNHTKYFMSHLAKGS